MLRILYRIVSFPLDVVSLTSFFLRLTRWLVRDGVRRMLSLDDPRPPCAYSGYREAAQADGKARPCDDAQGFSHPSCLRMLCPWVKESPDDQTPALCGLCGAGVPFQVDGRRYARTGVLLILLWVAVISAAYVVGRKVYVRIQWYRYAQLVERDMGSDESLRRAKWLEDRDRHAEARIEYMNAAKQEPTSVAAQLGLGACALKLGMAQEAENAYKAVLGLDAGNAAAHLVLAQMSRERSEHDAAVGHAEQAWKAAPSNETALAVLVTCLRDAGETEAAMERARHALAVVRPRSRDLLLMAGDLALKLNAAKEAEGYFRNALEDEPDLVVARVGLARSLRVRGDTVSAISVLERVLEFGPEDSAAVELADILVFQGKWVDALEMYREISERSPDLVGARERLAELLVRTGKPDAGYSTATNLLADYPNSVRGHLIVADLFLTRRLASLAVEHCRKAIEIDPRVVQSHSLLARAYVEAGSMEEAVEELRWLEKATPDDLRVKLDLVYCYEQLGMPDRAEESLEVATRTHPESAIPHVKLGQMNTARDDHKAAILSYRAALEIDPKQPVALNNLADLLLRSRGESEDAVAEAAELALRARRLRPDDPVIADTVGWALYHQGELDKALAALSYAARKLPRTPAVRYHLAEVLYKMGEQDAAETQLEAALSLSSNFKDAAAAGALLSRIREAGNVNDSPPK
ncbi:tetratricopeptide repeat protein [Verrucomicrobiota bacterium]